TPKCLRRRNLGGRGKPQLPPSVHGHRDSHRGTFLRYPSQQMTKRSVAAAAALVLAAGLAACATPTPYQPNLPGQQTSGGYSEIRVEPDRWRVSFAGNTLTSRETVEGYLLYRAAELTLQNGYEWFSIEDRHTDRDARTYVEPDPLYHPWY